MHSILSQPKASAGHVTLREIEIESSVESGFFWVEFGGKKRQIFFHSCCSAQSRCTSDGLLGRPELPTVELMHPTSGVRRGLHLNQGCGLAVAERPLHRPDRILQRLGGYSRLAGLGLGYGWLGLDRGGRSLRRLGLLHTLGSIWNSSFTILAACLAA